MKYGNLIPALIAFAMGASVQAATLTKTSKMSEADVESFRKIALVAQKVALNDYRTEMVFEVESFKVAGASSREVLEPVQEAINQLGYGAEPVEITDIDDQIDDAVSAAFQADLDAGPKAAKAKMAKLADAGSRHFNQGDERIHVFTASSMDANHYTMNAIIIYDVQAQEILGIASQQSE